MFRLAHFSDIHLGPLPDVNLRQLISKRITGYINWQRNRKMHLDDGIIDAISDDMLAMKPDHIALTGDLVNLALDQEIEMAGQWLESMGNPDALSVVLGNHDAYVPGTLEKCCRRWAGFMTGDDGKTPHSKRDFPYLRVRGPVALIGVCSARATVPFMASGYFREEQAEKTARLLDETKAMGLFRVIMIHHPPIHGATNPHKRLFGIKRFQKTVRKHGAELVLHGHTHLPTVHQMEGTNGVRVPVVGVAAAGQSHGSSRPPAHYNLFEISGSDEQWNVRLIRRGTEVKGGPVTELSSQTLEF